jgi:hypothetical protein
MEELSLLAPSELKKEPSVEKTFDLKVQYSGQYHRIYVAFSLHNGEDVKDVIDIHNSAGGWVTLEGNTDKYEIPVDEQRNIGFRVRPRVETTPVSYTFTIKATSESPAISAYHTVNLALEWENQILKFEAQDHTVVYEPGGGKQKFAISFERKGAKSVYFQYETVGRYKDGLDLPNEPNLPTEKTLQAYFKAPLGMPGGPLYTWRTGIKIYEYGKDGNSATAELKGRVAGPSEWREWTRNEIPSTAIKAKAGSEPSLFCSWNNQELQSIHIVYCGSENRAVELHSVGNDLRWKPADKSLPYVEEGQ